MTEHTLHERKKRVWEIDAIRGALILLVLCNHLNITVETFVVDGLYTNLDVHKWIDVTDPLHFWFDWGTDGVAFASPLITGLRKHLTYPVVDIFFIISGISCIFSRNNLKSGLRLLAGAAFVSLFTWVLTIVTGDEHQFIRFGALHCYALCHLIYYFLLEDRNDKVLIISAVVALVLGYTLRRINPYSDFALLVPFGIKEYGVSMRDYWPVFPMIGWFLIGVILGRRLYKEKRTRFPGLENHKWHRPLQFLGRQSGLIYCGHMVVYTLVFCGIGKLFKWY